MIRENLILTFDLGTQSIRASLINKYGREICEEKIAYQVPYYSKNDFSAEQDPDFYYQRISEASRNLFDRFDGNKEDIIACGITCIRDSCLCLDKDIKPLRPIILWADGRLTKGQVKVSPVTATALAFLGKTETVNKQFRASNCNWIIENEPEVWDKTYKFVLISSYINYQMTGKLLDSSANQVGHVPFDNKNNKWMGKADPMRFTFNIPEEKLCELVSPGELLGKITKKTSLDTGIPEGLELIATGSDKSCETLGLSVLDNDTAAISYGTTATIQFCTKKYSTPQPFLPAYASVVKDYFNPEYQIFRGYWMLKWFYKNFAEKELEQAKTEGIEVEKILDKKLKDVPSGCDGLVLLPFWSPGVENPLAKGAMLGFTDVVGKAHIYRAIIEGIGLTLYKAMKTMEKRAGKKIKYIYLGGGGGKSDAVAQITADIFGIPVRRINSEEPGSLGVAIACFVAKKTFDSYQGAVDSMVQIKDEFTPEREEHKKYLNIYNKLYHNLSSKIYPIFKKIHYLSR